MKWCYATVFIWGNTSELKPGKSRVEVVIQNRSEKDVKLKACTEIGTVIAANIVPSTQVSNDFVVGEQERVSCMFAQVESTDILGETPYESRDPKDILQSLICLEWRSGNLSCNQMFEA